VRLLRLLTCPFMAFPQAYRRLAKKLHPDKGGSSTRFAALQAAFETLIDPRKRAVYDALAPDIRFRPGAAAPYRRHNMFSVSRQPLHITAVVETSML